MSEHKMMRIALCDDKTNDLSQTISLVHNYMEAHPEACLFLECYKSAVALLDSLTKGKCYEIYLLDIIMPELNGINLGKAIRKFDEEAAIIYLTTSSDYAVESYCVNAFYYLLKPVEQETLFQVLDRAVLKRRGNWETSLLVKTSEGLIRLPLASLMFVEYNNHRLIYHMGDGSVIHGPYRSMAFDSAASDILADRRFLKVSSSFLVNLSYVQILTRKSFLLKGQEKLEIPISRAFYKEVKNLYLHYFMERRDMT